MGRCEVAQRILGRCQVARRQVARREVAGCGLQGCRLVVSLIGGTGYGVGLKMASAATETTPMERRGRSLWPIWALTFVMGAIAVALYVPVTSSAVDAGGDLTLPWVLLAAGFALAEVYSLHVGFRGEAWTFSVSEILLVLGLFAVSPSHLIAAELIGPLVVLVAVERQAPMKVCYNVAHFVLHAEVALLVFHAIAVPEGPLAVRNWIAALTAVLAGSIVQLFAISLAVTIVEGRLLAREMCRSFMWGTLCSLVNTMLGLVVVIVCSESLAAGALLLAPIAVVFVAYRAYLSENTKSEGLRFLYQASETLSGQNDFEDGLLALLVFARDTFHAELAEIVLVGESDEAVGYRTCSGPGERGFRLEPCDRGIVDAVLEVADGDDDVVQFQPPRGSLLARHEDTTSRA